MKDQYFGDISDYRKYGLLRIVQNELGGNLGVAWMLTENDESRDGALRSYLQQPDRWRDEDPELYDGLRDLVAAQPEPAVAQIETAGLLPRARFFSDHVPDGRDDRAAWTRRLMQFAQGADLVFVDPDNGIEVPSSPVGRKGSCKFVTHEEIRGLWNVGCSVLIYQHYRREKRPVFAQRMLAQLSETVQGGEVMGFHTPRVLFLWAIQPRHRASAAAVVTNLETSWGDQIRPVQDTDL